MQYSLYANKKYQGNVLIGNYGTLQEAKTQRDRLDRTDFDYAIIIETEWQKEPRVVSSLNFEYERPKTLIKKPR